MRTYVHCSVAGIHIGARRLNCRQMIKERAVVNLSSDATRFFQPISELAATHQESAMRLGSRPDQMSSGAECVCVPPPPVNAQENTVKTLANAA